MSDPARTLESHGIQDQTDPDGHWSKQWSCDNSLNRTEHHMISVKTNSGHVPYVERCAHCGWIDGMSLNWWVDNAIKCQINARMRRIAVSAESEPFAFVQSSIEELPLEEILFQALGAASLAWEGSETFDVNRFKGDRARAISDALLAEVQRYIDLARQDAATRAVEYLQKSADAFYLAVRKAIEG